ncbi:hypothetical protein Drorol1_Dr00008133 [Drosera rotundifolia]
MDSSFFVFYLCLLMTVLGLADHGLLDEADALRDLGGFNVHEAADIDMLEERTWSGSQVIVSVDSFGAIGDGISDDTQAFVNAWAQACSIPKAIFLVPPGRTYLVNATRFKGPCSKNLIIEIDGTIVAPDNPKDWNPKFSRLWLDFYNLTGVLFRGIGVIEGSGSKWWAASCKKNKTNPCKAAPSAFTIEKSSAIRVKGLMIQNSQQMHLVISQCDSVRVSDVLISAPGDSPNTDGIHISDSTNVVLQNCKIGTGDDCISIVNASTNIKMKSIYCGPGHGISIGSLGKDNSSAVVTKVVLDGAYLKNTTNGLRIKTWQGGSGYVKAVQFENVRMQDVANPIIVDQFYCDSPIACQNQTSAVQISEIVYKNISGTTISEDAMKFACSDTVPCSDIVLHNVNLIGDNGGSVETFCNSVTGFEIGIVRPAADCLSSNQKDSNTSDIRIALVADSRQEFPSPAEL